MMRRVEVALLDALQFAEEFLLAHHRKGDAEKIGPLDLVAVFSALGERKIVIKHFLSS